MFPPGYGRKVMGNFPLISGGNTASIFRCISRAFRELRGNARETSLDPAVSGRTPLTWVYKRDIHQIWDDVFANTPIMDVKVIVGHRNSRNIKSERIHTRPCPSLLVDKYKKTEC